jgi:putative copper resistance protein D
VTRIVVVWLHVVAAAVWLGGLAFSAHLLVPTLLRGDRAVLALLGRARVSAWAALALLLVTGLENLRQVGLGRPWVMAKLLAVMILLALAAHRDFALVPRATSEIERGTPPGLALSGLRWLDRILLLLALVVVFLGVGVARGR